MPSIDLRSPARVLGRAPDLRLLLGAGLVSMTGDYVLSVGLVYSVYALTGSTLASAAALLSAFVPQVVMGSRRRRLRRPLGPQADDGRAPTCCSPSACSPCCWCRAWTGSGWSTSCWRAQSCLEVFFAPAEQAFLPHVVDDEDLVAANGLNAQFRNVARLVGSGVGGVVAAAGGIRAIAVVDAVTFVLAALLVSRIRTAGRVAVSAGSTGSAGDGDATDVVRGRMAALVGEWRAGTAHGRGEPRRAHPAARDADHQHRRGDHGHAVRTVRPPRAARQWPGLRPDHRGPGDRRGRRRLRRRGPGQPVVGR